MPFRVLRPAPVPAAHLAAAVVALLLHVPPAAAAEVALAGEPFEIAERPEAVGTPGVTWLPHAGPERPAGFFLLWGEGEDEDQRSLVGGFVPEDGEASPAPAFPVAGPARRFDLAVAAGLDGRVGVAFTGPQPPCLGGVLLASGLEVDATLDPIPPDSCVGLGVDAALLPSGRMVVVHEMQTGIVVGHLEAQIFTADGAAVGEPVEIARTGDLIRLREVVAAPGGFLVFFAGLTQNRFTSPFGPSTLFVQRFGPDGRPLAAPVVVHEAPNLVSELSVVRVSGGWAAAWREETADFDDGSFIGFVPFFFARPLAVDGAPAGPVRPLLHDLERRAHSLLLQPAPGDLTLLVWSEGDDARTAVRARLLGADLAPAGEPVTLADRGAAVATSPAGDGLLAWRDEDGTIVGQRFTVDAGCAPSETVLCLQDGRFELTVDWAEPRGAAGPGRRVPVASDDSGLFWFFHPDNWELLVKVLDGCPVNGHFWVFSAATTNVEYTLTVNDLVARETRVFRNTLGETARAVTATNAFPTCAPPPAP